MTKPTERRSINKGIKKYLRCKFLIETPDNSVMCNKCRHIYRNESVIYTCNQSDKCTVSSSDQQKSPPSVSLSLVSTAASCLLLYMQKTWSKVSGHSNWEPHSCFCWKEYSYTSWKQALSCAFWQWSNFKWCYPTDSNNWIHVCFVPSLVKLKPMIMEKMII